MFKENSLLILLKPLFQKKVSSYKIIETARSKNNFCTKCQETFSGDFLLKNYMIENKPAAQAAGSDPAR